MVHSQVVGRGPNDLTKLWGREIEEILGPGGKILVKNEGSKRQAQEGPVFLTKVGGGPAMAWLPPSLRVAPPSNHYKKKGPCYDVFFKWPL